VLADLTVITRRALDEVAACGDLAALEDARVRWLGKKGRITELLKSAGKRVASEGPEAVARVQRARNDLEVEIMARRASARARPARPQESRTAHRALAQRRPGSMPFMLRSMRAMFPPFIIFIIFCICSNWFRSWFTA